MKKQYQLEYSINTSPKLIFKLISSASGLSEWFADEVTINKGLFTFNWNGSEQVAEKIEAKKNDFIKFKWCDNDDDSFFEFRINRDEITSDVALLITGFADETDFEEEKQIWDQQIYTLKHHLGLE